MSEQRIIIASMFALGLLAIAACVDEFDEGLDSGIAQFHAIEIQRQLEQNGSVELQRVGSQSSEFELDEEVVIEFIEVTDVNAPAAEGSCGWGYWEYQSRSMPCGSCNLDYQNTGQQYNHYKRWCWEGPPSCGGCGGWQYTGWSCLGGCEASEEVLDTPFDRAAVVPAAPTLELSALYDTAQPNEVEITASDEFGLSETYESFEGIDDVNPSSLSGTCGGYWDYQQQGQLQGCGTCVHSVPEPDRSGNLSKFYRRWCWTGGWGCSGCEGWQTYATYCYDTCG